MNFRFTTFGGKCERPGRFTSDAQRRAVMLRLNDFSRSANVLKLNLKDPYVAKSYVLEKLDINNEKDKVGAILDMPPAMDGTDALDRQQVIGLLESLDDEDESPYLRGNYGNFVVRRAANSPRLQKRFSKSNKFAIRFTEPDYLKGDKDYVPVEVDVDKFDEHWARNPENYFEKESVGLKDRYECVVKVIKDKKEIDMPEVYARPKEDAVKVADGRHRLAAIRDLGFKEEKILVPKFQKKWFEDNVGIDGKKTRNATGIAQTIKTGGTSCAA